MTGDCKLFLTFIFIQMNILTGQPERQVALMSSSTMETRGLYIYYYYQSRNYENFDIKVALTGFRKL